MLLGYSMGLLFGCGTFFAGKFMRANAERGAAYFSRTMWTTPPSCSHTYFRVAGRCLQFFGVLCVLFYAVFLVLHFI